jgi:hypothetical protein
MFALMVLLASASSSPAPVEAAIPPDAAVIINSGSTNTAPYRIVVRPDGSVHVELQAQAPQAKTLSTATATAFFKDLKSAMPLDGLQTEPCVKSASFGTSTYVQYQGTKTPDLACATGDAAKRLSADVNNITSELKINAFRNFQGGANHVLPEPSPTPKS